MTSEQLAILNSLVTYAAENIPGGLSVDEREVAQIVGKWALKGTMEVPLPKQYRPIFAGKTAQDEKVIIYIREGTREHHIQRPDGTFMAMSPGAEVESWRDPFTEIVSVIVRSPEWTGQASGTRHDLLEAEMR